MLLTHDHPPSHHHHHHHPQYHPQYHPHHSHHPSQQQQRHHHKPATHPIPMSSSDRPTLPGIASILAFAAQDPPPQLSSPESSSHPRPNATRLLQSSDPVAHALPAFASIPSFLQSNNTTHPNATPLFDSTKHHHHVHRRRSSSITIVQEQPSLESTSPSSSSGPTQNSTPNQPSRTSFRDLCHPSNRPFRREPYHSTPDPQPSNPPPLNNSTAPPHTHNYHHLHQTHISHDALQRRHSDRISAPNRSQPSHYHHYHHHHHHHNHHPLLPGRSTSPNQQQHPCLNSDCSRQTSFIKTAAVPTPARDDRAVKHIRRPSNASQSSSSSISGSVSVSSDFGASSLSIGSQSNLNRGAHHSSSSSSQSINIISNNKTFSTSCNDTQSSQTEPPPPWPPEEDEPPNKTFDERRGYNHPPQQRRSHDDTSGLQNHRSTSGSQSSPNQHHHQHSLSPPINSLSSRLVGGPMINNNHNNSFPPLGPQHHRYQCMEPGCGKTFSRPSSLKIHSYSHTGQKPFKCMRCDRAFSVQSNLKRHQKVHEKRSVAGPARPVSTAHPSGGLSMALMHDPGAPGGRPLISEESGDEDHESDLGMYHRMEE